MTMSGEPRGMSEVRIDAHLDASWMTGGDGSVPDPRIAIACMSKGADPEAFKNWLLHHIHLGVERFFLRIEDANDSTRGLLSLEEFRNHVRVLFADGSHVRDCGNMQNSRQDEHLQVAIRAARQEGYSHILHIDDDEVLFLPAGRDSLLRWMRSVPDSSSAELHLRNLEALAPIPSPAHLMSSGIRSFRHRPNDYCGYGQLQGSTGKSMGVLSHAGLVPLGPHHFGRCEPSGLAVGRVGLLAGRARRAALSDQNAETTLVPPPIAVILHFHCATFEQWQNKYIDHVISLHSLGLSPWGWVSEAGKETRAGPGTEGEVQSDGNLGTDIADIECSFHAESCRAAAAVVAAAAASDRDADTAAAASSRTCWERWKLEPDEVRRERSNSEEANLLPAGRSYRVLQGCGITIVRLPQAGK